MVFMKLNFFLVVTLSIFINVANTSAQVQFNVGSKGSYFCSSDHFGIAHLFKISGSETKEVSIKRMIRKWKTKRRNLRLNFPKKKRASVRNQLLILNDQINSALDCAKLNVMKGACDIFQSIPSGADLKVLPIIDGALCEGYNSPVVELSMYDENDLYVGSCTGTVLNSKTVLSAAHCALASDNVKYAEIKNTNDEIVIANQIYYHPNYGNPNQFAEYNDIAIFKTDQDINANTMSLHMEHDLTIGEIMAMAGYGLDENRNFGELKAGFSLLHSYDEESVTIKFRPGSGSNSCYGDSGGPLTIYRGTEWKIIGVTSNGSNSTCGINQQDDLSNWSKVSSPSNLEFIQSVAPELF
jgi:hypothetical protein